MTIEFKTTTIGFITKESKTISNHNTVGCVASYIKLDLYPHKLIYYGSKNHSVKLNRFNNHMSKTEINAVSPNCSM